MTVQFCPVSIGFLLIRLVSLLACKLVKAINAIGCLAFHVCLATNTQWHDGHKKQELSVIPLVLPAPCPINLPRAFLQMLLSWPVAWPLWTVSPELPSSIAHQGCLPVAETCRRWDRRRDTVVLPHRLPSYSAVVPVPSKVPRFFRTLTPFTQLPSRVEEQEELLPLVPGRFVTL